MEKIPFYEAWIENDYNPFISFDENGRIITLNKEAQYLLGIVTPKKIFDLTKTYANISYGFKTTIIDLSFKSFSFYAITVGYLNDQEIGIKLYKKNTKKFSPVVESGEFVNIYSLIDLCISATNVNPTNIKHYKIFDPTFPEIKLKIDEFTKLINKIYRSYIKSETITTKLTLNTGEHINSGMKKYPIFTLQIKGDSRDKEYEKSIEDISTKANTNIQFDDDKTILSSAMISN